MTNADRIAEAQGGHRSGAGWMLHCPAHPDRTPSLSVSDGENKTLVHCHAGCSQADVIAALRDRGLWPDHEPRFETKHHDYAPHGGDTVKRNYVAEYDYSDETGALLYQVLRYEPGPDGKKQGFSQRYPDGHGDWIWKKAKRQVLFHLPEVLETPIVFVVEGEKDVETLRSYGFVATTPPGGVDAPWLPCFTDALRGRELIIWPDGDAPGRRKALKIAQFLLGAAARLRMLDIRCAKDATEWFEQGHSETEFIDLTERLEIPQ